MTGQVPPGSLAVGVQPRLPTIIAFADARTSERYLEFFAANIRNRNTRAAYLTAAEKFFSWCDRHELRDIHSIGRLQVAAYIEQLTHIHAAPTVKQNLAAIKMLFAFLRTHGDNPAEGVRGPKHVVHTGRTPVLSAEQAGRLLASIDAGTLAGKRDRALISVMIYSFGRISAVVGMDVDDYHMNGDRRWIRVREKGGKEHAVPVHADAAKCVDAYIAAAGITSGPLFRTLAERKSMSDVTLSRFAAWEMVKRRARVCGLPKGTTNHTFRATGITVYLENGGSIENARNIAAHASIKTTQTYDRRGEQVRVDEVGRIRLAHI